MGKYKSKLAYTARDTSRRDIDNWGSRTKFIMGNYEPMDFK
jgi:hypothetical protein